MANIRDILAKNMKENRRRLGLTQSDLAERAEISTNFVAMIELMHKFPSPEILERIAQALEIENNALFYYPSSEEDTMHRLQQVFLDNISRVIEGAIDKAIDKKLKNN